MNIVFFGTSSFAIPSIEALKRSGNSPLLVVTQKDKPGGRQNKLIESPIKKWALKNGIPISQPEDLSSQDFQKTLKELSPDLFVLVSYGKILPESLLNIPSLGGMNVHPSLLPKYRGASPIVWTILNGDQKTGVSIIRIAQEVDSGDILLQKELPLQEEDAIELSEKLSRLGADLLSEALSRIQDPSSVSTPQEGEASFAPRLKKEDGLVDWTKPATHLACQIRALVPWPGSFAYLRGKRVIFWKAQALPDASEGAPGSITAFPREGLIKVTTGKGSLIIKELQLEGKPRVTSVSFLRGNPLKNGETFTCNPAQS